MPELSVVVPAYNEARRIGRTLPHLAAYVTARCAGAEVIVVDDGSADGTAAVVEDVVAALPVPGLVRLVRLRVNRGKGYAVRRGVLVSRGELVLTTDADLATPIEDLDRLQAAIAAGADVAVGSRAVARARILVHQPRYREWMGRAFNVLVRAAILPGIYDTQCGFKLFRGFLARSLFAAARVDGFAYDVEVLGLARAAGLVVVEVPVRWSHVEDSRVRPGRDALVMLRDLLAIAYRVHRSRVLIPRPVAPSVPG
jgi:dolichyl-phosphate beta-glucosyltransferase